MKKIITLCAAMAFISSVGMADTSSKVSTEALEAEKPAVRCGTWVNGIYVETWGITATHCINRLSDIVAEMQ